MCSYTYVAMATAVTCLYYIRSLVRNSSTLISQPAKIVKQLYFHTHKLLHYSSYVLVHSSHQNLHPYTNSYCLYLGLCQHRYTNYVHGIGNDRGVLYI